MASDKEPGVWLTVLKLVLGAAALIGLVWGALWYLEKYGSGPEMNPSLKPKMDWGIANDSPIPSRR
ncbi:hypothetical protein [Rhodoferax sp.]|uniref:hypothetical protein n=1 Tax=Rhodoferax sp. TaxID=50421 RepID=UPI0025CE0B90|nr:hypothetical protein [Rhodoferax sp.]